jgi:bla regulator protein BlaR1
MEKLIATALVLALLTLWTVRSADNAPQLKAAAMEAVERPLVWLSELGQEFPVLAQAGLDTVPPAKKARKEKFIHDDGQKRVEMEMQDGKMTRLNIDGKEIPPAEFDAYRAETDELRRSVVAPMPPAAPGTPAMPGGVLTPPTAPTPATPATPPFPGLAPMPPAQLSTAKDADGNTVIRLEGPGKPTELVVKNGEVWVDGRKLSEGEAISIDRGAPGFFHGLEGSGGQIWIPSQNSFSWSDLEAQGINFDGQSFEISKEDMDRMEEDLRRALEEHDVMMKDFPKMEKQMQEEMKKTDKELRKLLKESRKDMEKANKEMMKAHKEMAKDREALRAEAWGGNRHYYRTESNPSEAILRQLREDKLITDESNFSVDLSSKELKVNGKTQPKEVLQRYLELYRRETGQEMTEKTRFRIVEAN